MVPRIWNKLFVIALAAGSAGCGLVMQKDLQTISTSGNLAPSNLSSSNGKTVFDSAIRQLVTTAPTQCSHCHAAGGVQANLPFADANLDTAYNAAKVMNLVNFQNPSASKLLTYISNGHCGSSECNVTDAATKSAFAQAAQQWATAEITPTTTTTSTPAPGASPTPAPTPTPPPMVNNPNATYTYINKNVIQVSCISCHSTANAGAKGGGFDLSSYALVTAPNLVTKGDPMNSTFYTVILEGAMPQGGATPVTADLQQDIHDWINNQAPNN